jgi:type IX secretion system PorP/SprF family membrane protein
MKTIRFFLIGFLFLPAIAEGQYLPTTGQPFQFAPVYNPAFTGIDPFGDIRLAYRSQLGTYGANSPTFFNGLYQFRLNQPYSANLNSFRTGTTRPENATRASGIVHGMGVNVFDEQLGMISRRGGGVSYSFHFPITEKLMLAVGTSAMVESLRIDPDKVYLGANADPDPVYQQILNGKTNNTQLNARAGAVLYSQDFYVGVSYLPVWKLDLRDASWMTASSIYKATFQAGYNFNLSETIHEHRGLRECRQPCEYGLCSESIYQESGLGRSHVSRYANGRCAAGFQYQQNVYRGIFIRNVDGSVEVWIGESRDRAGDQDE